MVIASKHMPPFRAVRSQDIEAIREKLIDSQRTIAVAESVTAGLVQGAFSQAEDPRLFFQGGITACNVAQKCRHLCVEPIHAVAFYSIYEGGQALETAPLEGFEAKPLELQLYYAMENMKALRRTSG